MPSNPDDLILFGVRDPISTLRLPQPPWPWYFEFKVNQGATDPNSWPNYLHLKRLPLPDGHELNPPRDAS